MLRQLLAEDDPQPNAHANVIEALIMRGPMLLPKGATLRHLACAPRHRIARLQGRIPALLLLAQRAMTVDILRKRQIMAATAGTPTRARMLASARRTVPATVGIALTAITARAAAAAHIAATARTATIAPLTATALAAAIARTARTAQVAVSCPHHQSLIAIVNCVAVTHVLTLPSTRSREIPMHPWSTPCVNQQQRLGHPSQPAATPGTPSPLKGAPNALTGKAQRPMVP